MTAQTTEKNRWLALYVLCAGVLMIVLDVTVVNVALPSIQDDLGFSQSSLAWVVNAYLIAFGGLLLLAGRFGDILGRKDVFLAGLFVFTVCPAASCLAHGQRRLVGPRSVQGIGGPMTSAVVLGMIVTMFPEPKEQAKAIGVYAFVASAGGSVGLVAGGVLTESINWHWIFFINVPVGILTAILAQRLIGRDKGIGFAGGTDFPGAILITGALMLGVYTIVKPAAEQGWGSTAALGLGAASIALLAAFIAREATAANPLVPLRIFRSRNVSGANIVQALLVAGMFGMFFMGALYLERVLGYDPLEIGLAFLPTPPVVGLLSLRESENLIRTFGARRSLLTGMVFLAAGLALFARVPVDATYVIDVLPSLIVLGAGVGVAFPSLMTLAMSGATPEDAGLASGLVNATAQVGGALGLAVLATLSTTRTESLIDKGESTASALTGGYHLAFLIGAALVVAAIVVGLTVIERPRKQPQDERQKTSAHTEPAYGE